MPSQVLSWFVGHCGWSIFPPWWLSKEHMHQTSLLFLLLAHTQLIFNHVPITPKHQCLLFVMGTRTLLKTGPKNSYQYLSLRKRRVVKKFNHKNCKDYSNQLTEVIFWTIFTLLGVKCLKSWARNTKRPKNSSFVYLNLRHFRLQTTTPTHSCNSSWISSS